MSGVATHSPLAAASGATIAAATAPVAGIGPDAGSQRWGLALADWREAAARATASDRCSASSTAAWNDEDRAWRVLIDMPAPHGPALLWKLECLMEVSGDGDGESAGWSGNVVAAVMADARRMLGAAA